MLATKDQGLALGATLHLFKKQESPSHLFSYCQTHWSLLGDYNETIVGPLTLWLPYIPSVGDIQNIFINIQF